MNEESNSKAKAKQHPDDLPENLLSGFDVISVYTRAQAIEDGVLVDVSEIEVIKLHWKHPFAITCALWEEIEKQSGGDETIISGILHDLSFMAKTVFRSPDPSIRLFEAYIGKQLYRLKLHVGAGDSLEPVLTLMYEHED